MLAYIDVCQSLARVKKRASRMSTPTLNPANVSTETSEDLCCVSTHGEEVLQLEEAELLAARFKALSDPNRLRILSIVSSSETSETCVCDLSEPLDLKQPTVSRHLKILVDAGILHREKRGVWAYFSVIPGALESLASSLVIKK